MFNGKETRELRQRLSESEDNIKRLRERIKSIENTLIDTGILDTITYFYSNNSYVYNSNKKFNANKLVEYLGIELKETPTKKEYVKKGKSK